MVYSFPQGGTTIYTGNNAEFVRQLDDGALLTEWKAKDRAGQQAITALRDLKKLARQDQLRAALDPLHIAYESMTSRERGQFIAWVTRYIMEGKG